MRRRVAGEVTFGSRASRRSRAAAAASIAVMAADAEDVADMGAATGEGVRAEP